MAKKRGNNEGSILRRKNGTWRAQVTLEGRRLSFSAKTRQECQEWVKKTLGQIENGLTFSGASATIEEFLDGWLTSIEYTLRPRSII